MTEIQFDNILNKPESSILDFKKSGYDFTNDTNQEQTAKFVKDIISFANTIRTESAFIIIGIGENNNNTKELVGITDRIDDAILQDKVKDKAYPRPSFSYYTFLYKGLTYGIIEIPVQKYTHPIAPTVKLKSLEVGKVYFRKGSTNTEALGIETISINDWLKSLPENITTNDSGEEISDLVKRTTNKQENLSSILADVLKVSKKYKLDSLTRFATLELQGFKQSDFDENPDSFKYRNQTFYCSYKELETVIVVDTATRQQIKNNLIKDSAFRKVIYPSGDTITNLEILLNKYKTDPKHFVNINTTTSKILFPEETGTPYDIYLYAFEDTFVNLYQSIRQKIIDNLVSAT